MNLRFDKKDKMVIEDQRNEINHIHSSYFRLMDFISNSTEGDGVLSRRINDNDDDDDDGDGRWLKRWIKVERF